MHHPNRRRVKILALLLTGSLTLGGCATPGGDSGAPAGSESGGCNTGIAAAVGAVAGALIGGGNDTVKGALIGGAVGALACVAYNYHVRQVKSAQQVQEDYRAAHQGKLPQDTVVDRYETRFSPAVIKPGEKTELVSYVQIVQGQDSPTPLVEEAATLYAPNGKALKTLRKQVNQDAASGAFQSTFALALPSGVPQGRYRMDTVLYLNGKEVAKRNTHLQVARLNAPDMTRLASLGH